MSWNVRARKPFRSLLILPLRKLRPGAVTQLIALLVSVEVRPEPWLPACRLVLFIFPLHGKPIWISFKPWGYSPVPMVLARTESTNVFQARFQHRFLFCLPCPRHDCSQPPIDQRSVSARERRDPGRHRVAPHPKPYTALKAFDSPGFQRVKYVI